MTLKVQPQRDIYRYMSRVHYCNYEEKQQEISADASVGGDKVLSKAKSRTFNQKNVFLFHQNCPYDNDLA